MTTDPLADQLSPAQIQKSLKIQARQPAVFLHGVVPLYNCAMHLFQKFRDDSFRSHNCTIVGDVTAGEKSSFWFNAVVRGDVAPVIIGKRSNVQDNAVVHCDTGVPNVIGDDVVIGHGAIVHGKQIGDGSLIGMGATVLSRSVIGKGCLIAAGAVVPPDLVVPDGMCVMGVPGKIVRPVKPAEVEYMQWLSSHYVELAEKYLRGEFDAREAD